MACLDYQVENVRTLLMEITRASQKGEQEASEMSIEIMSKWSTFVSVGAGKGGIYTCLFVTPPWLKLKVGIVVRRGWG